MPSDIPRGLMRVIVRCLQKDPRRRYADVAELALALEEFASAPGAAARIRAVLDTPRPQLEPARARVAVDPNAETKTAASIDTTQRVLKTPRVARGRWLSCGGPRARRRCRVWSRCEENAPLGFEPRRGAVGVATSPPSSRRPSAATAVESSVPPLRAPRPRRRRPRRRRRAAVADVKSGPRARRSDSARAEPTRAPLDGAARASAPVLVPKTTEF